MERKKKIENAQMEKRTLSLKEKAERGVRAAKMRIDADAREQRLSANGSAERKRIKEIRAEAHEYEVQISQGFEMVPARSLFSDKNMKKLDAKKKESKKASAKKVAAPKGGNGKAANVSNLDDISRAATVDREASATTH